MNNQNNEEWREEFIPFAEIDSFIQKWCGENAKHLLDTDDNDGQRLREVISTQLAKAEKRGEERIIKKLKEGYICECCGGYKDPENLTSMCDKCLEEN